MEIFLGIFGPAEEARIKDRDRRRRDCLRVIRIDRQRAPEKACASKLSSLVWR